MRDSIITPCKVLSPGSALAEQVYNAAFLLDNRTSSAEAMTSKYTHSCSFLCSSILTSSHSWGCRRLMPVSQAQSTCNPAFAQPQHVQKRCHRLTAPTKTSRSWTLPQHYSGNAMLQHKRFEQPAFAAAEWTAEWSCMTSASRSWISL